MPPLRDVEHSFRDQKGAAGVCRVRVFASPEASGGLPVVILTELATNDGPSVTNTVEQLAAEILTRYLGGQDGLEPPFVRVEHYPDSGCRRDPMLVVPTANGSDVATGTSLKQIATSALHESMERNGRRPYKKRRDQTTMPARTSSRCC